ncbi:MAG: hypothetical protein U1E41_11975 [Paracoccus sp. (in: a-proteobacteria)]
MTGAKPVKSFAVTSVAHLKGRSPMEVEWHVLDKSGQAAGFNIIIEGVNMARPRNEPRSGRCWPSAAAISPR